MANFASTLNRGFHMTFRNGVEISVQWGYGNYCSNRDLTKGYLDSMKTHILEANTAEILIMKGDKNLTSRFIKETGISHDGTVAGWVNSDEVADAIAWAKGYVDMD